MLPQLCFSEIHYHDRKIFTCQLLYSATGAAQDSLFCPRTPQRGEICCQRATDKGRSLCSPLRFHVPNKTHQGQINQMESPPGPDGGQGFDICRRDVSRLHSEAQDKAYLTSPAAVSSDSDLAKRYRWDGKCPLDTAIKFHFEIMLAKVSLNPSQG